MSHGWSISFELLITVIVEFVIYGQIIWTTHMIFIGGTRIIVKKEYPEEHLFELKHLAKYLQPKVECESYNSSLRNLVLQSI